jgi:hypothetical protein
MSLSTLKPVLSHTIFNKISKNNFEKLIEEIRQYSEIHDQFYTLNAILQFKNKNDIIAASKENKYKKFIRPDEVCGSSNIVKKTSVPCTKKNCKLIHFYESVDEENNSMPFSKICPITKDKKCENNSCELYHFAYNAKKSVRNCYDHTLCASQSDPTGQCIFGYKPNEHQPVCTNLFCCNNNTCFDEIRECPRVHSETKCIEYCGYNNNGACRNPGCRKIHTKNNEDTDICPFGLGCIMVKGLNCSSLHKHIQHSTRENIVQTCPDDYRDNSKCYNDQCGFYHKNDYINSLEIVDRICKENNYYNDEAIISPKSTSPESISPESNSPEFNSVEYDSSESSTRSSSPDLSPKQSPYDCEPKAQSKLQAKPKAKHEPKVEVKPKPKVEAKPKSKPKSKPKVNAEVKVETKVETKVESEVEIEVKPEPEVKVETKVETKVESEVEVEVKPEIKPEVKVDNEILPEVRSMIESILKTDTVPENKDVVEITIGNKKCRFTAKNESDLQKISGLIVYVMSLCETLSIVDQSTVDNNQNFSLITPLKSSHVEK